MRKYAFGCALLLSIAGLAWYYSSLTLKVHGIADVEELARDQVPSATQHDAPAAEAAGVVRIVLQEDPGNARSSEGESVVFGEYQHTGPLDPAAMEGTIGNLQQLILGEHAVLGTLSDNTLDFAEAMHSLAVKECAIDALRAGKYVTTSQGEKAPSANIPGAEVLVTGGRVGGKAVKTSVILADADYPGLKRARDQYAIMRHLDDWQKSDRFNALPEAERRAKAEEIISLMRKPDVSSAELVRIYETIGRNVDIDPRTGTVSVRPVR